jgi:hypothetical protein
LLHYINLQCFRRYLFRDSESYGSLIPERAVSLSRILLSTWSISKAVGPFDMTNIGGGSISWKGDLDLEEVLGISNTFNATVLEFDFIPLTNFISFNYILLLMNINLTFLANTQMVCLSN